MRAIDQLLEHQRETEALRAISGRLSWDQETMMSAGSAEGRAFELATIEKQIHLRESSDQVADWIAAVDETSLNEVEAAHLRLLRRKSDQARKMPTELVTEIAKETSLGQATWAKARAEGNVADFLPVLDTMVRLRREEAAALDADADPYDVLVDQYEAGIGWRDLDALFKELRPTLVDLRAAVMEQPAPDEVQGEFPAEMQLAFARKLGAAFQYDFNRGRMDLAVHPFSSGSGNDVRVTTRTSLRDPFNCFYSMIHEVGHASYELNIDPAYEFTVLGRGVSMGVHESQSRIYENQLGRSRAFTGWMYRQMRNDFGDFGIKDEEAFYKAVNKVRDGYIRTEADELQYNLHVMLRFDLERAMIQGDLAVKDAEAAWNDRFEADFGYAVDRPSNGLLQDVHWSVGLMGYFPTYSLGNIYAGCLYDGLRADVPNLDHDLAVGDLGAAVGWLSEKVQKFGGLRTPRATIEDAISDKVSIAPLAAYLRGKFSDLYDL